MNSVVCVEIDAWRLHRPNLIMTLIQSARMNGHDPCAYLRDAMARLPRQRTSQIDVLQLHRLQPLA